LEEFGEILGSDCFSGKGARKKREGGTISPEDNGGGSQDGHGVIGTKSS